MNPDDPMNVTMLESEHDKNPHLATIVLAALKENEHFVDVVNRVKTNRGGGDGPPTLLELDAVLSELQSTLSNFPSDMRRARRMLMDIREGRANILLMEAAVGA